jgi:hypothetical protein
MYLDENSIEISKDNGTTYIKVAQYITEAKFGYNKVWSNDAGRNLAGKQSGTLVGIFPKIVLTFKPLNKSELNIIAPYLDNPSQKIKYYDPNKDQIITIETYTGDWENTQNNIKETQTFNCSFIAREKRA